VTPDALLELFAETAAAVRTAVDGIPAARRRDRTERPGQYALDLVADAAACAVLERAPVRIVSEESGAHERAGAAVTVVIDPVDGSTNCARGIPYWCTSLCAVDADGLLASLVANHPASQSTTATRGGGAFRDGTRLRTSTATRLDQSVIAFNGWPPRPVASKQTRVLGSIALELCDVAAGGLDGYACWHGAWVAPWDYLGGLLAVLEAGAHVRDGNDEDLVVSDVDARRRPYAAGTPELLDALFA
jgi:fructose-1,6-bisphosphatase/inositol monophosphatase family enzyme